MGWGTGKGGSGGEGQHAGGKDPGKDKASDDTTGTRPKDAPTPVTSA